MRTAAKRRLLRIRERANSMITSLTEPRISGANYSLLYCSLSGILVLSVRCCVHFTDTRYYIHACLYAYARTRARAHTQTHTHTRTHAHMHTDELFPKSLNTFEFLQWCGLHNWTSSKTISKQTPTSSGGLHPNSKESSVACDAKLNTQSTKCY